MARKRGQEPIPILLRYVISVPDAFSEPAFSEPGEMEQALIMSLTDNPPEK